MEPTLTYHRRQFGIAHSLPAPVGFANIGGFITVSVILGVAMLAEALLFLRFGWSRFDLATNNNAFYTFSFLMLLYFAAFSVLSARMEPVG